MDTWVVECSKCSDRLKVQLPEGLTREEVIGKMKETGWDILPTLCLKHKEETNVRTKNN